MAQGEQKKVVAVLPQGGAAAENPKYLNCVENGLGLRDWLESSDHMFITTADKEGPNSELAKNLHDANVIITTPFHPAYMTRDLIMKAPKLELILTAGVGSDHIDLHAAADKGITVAEVINNEWDVPAIAVKAYDIKGKTVGTAGGGRISFEVMKRLEAWDVKRIYYDRHQKADRFDKNGIEWEKDLHSFMSKGMFNKEAISKMKRGSFIVNNARGSIVDQDAVAEALKSGQLGGYAGDVWPQQPAAPEHPWRHMPNHAMTPHISGTTLDAQARYAGGVRDMLQAWIEHKPFEEDFYIVREGKLASQYQ
ncbi:Formate dehydrogenase, mitochondrial [Coccomyxa sp. Obi]|nr:Formate dehydrogenase, mitochondrial [Coccomyxa sp. Obi]